MAGTANAPATAAAIKCFFIQYSPKAFNEPWEIFEWPQKFNFYKSKF
jgi:hypothetical protein